ncbi:MAG: hypothetical protein ACFFC3_00770 [Candidatus Odinarchaeota archaeon]
MPRAIILYEIDPSFGPNIIAEYYLKQKEKISPAILKEFSDKHISKELFEATIFKEDNRYFSKKIKTESLQKENLYISFILQEGEDIVSLKSIFENIEKKIVQNYTDDKNKMNKILQDALNSVLSLLQKLQEPKIIKETINERTKKMLDDGKLTEARDLIDLGEDVPEKLAAEVKLAEQFLIDAFYRKAKKSYLKAADLAEIIQEDEIASFLRNKGEQVGLFPDLLKERVTLNKQLEKIFNDIDISQIYLYNNLIEPIDKLIEIAHSFEDQEFIENLTKLKQISQRAFRLAKELHESDEKIGEILKKF